MPRNKLQKEEAADDDKIAQDQQGHHHHVVGQVASFVFLGRLHKEEEEDVTVDNEQRKVEEVDVNDKLQNTVLLTIKLQEQDTADNDKKAQDQQLQRAIISTMRGRFCTATISTTKVWVKKE